MADSQNKWVVRDARGRIYGPFTTAKVMTYIERGVFAGGEMIARYPGGDWHVISKEAEFYDKLLEVLATDGTRPLKIPEEVPEAVDQKHSISVSSAKSSKSANTSKPPQEKEKTARVEVITPEPPGRRVIKEAPKQSFTDSIIELTNISQMIRREQLKKAKIPLAAIATVIVLGVVWLALKPTKVEKIHLLAPRPGQPAISASAVKSLYQTALHYFERDTFEGYLSAQNDLVQIAEGSPKDLNGLALLCLTYKELWPFSHQDSRDMNVVNTVSEHAMELDPVGYDGATCRAAQLMISGRYTEAESVVQGTLEAYPTAAVLYQLMSEIMAVRMSHEVAIDYSQKIQQLWPSWLKPYVTEAELLEHLDRYGQADEILQKVLKANPDHLIAKIEMGNIQLTYFHDFDKAQDFLQSALSSKKRITALDESRGYLLLAKVFAAKNENKRAVSAAQKCYSLNSTNVDCREIVIQLGGYDKLKSIPREDRDAMIIGDNFAKTGDCFAAQAEYKAAYQDDNKNATAAFKAAKCLWQLSYSNEALDWLQKAILADPTYTEAYTTLAEYQARKYDFDAAFEILAKIQRLKPKDYRVYTGFAQVEYLQNNFKAAIEYGQKALKIYDADVDTHLLISKSYLNLRQYNDAYRFVSRAVELDHENIQANCLYAKVLAGIKGVDAGLNYIEDFVNRYTAILDYRLAKAEILTSGERYPEAKAVYQQVLSIDPQNKKALIGLGEVNQNLNLADEALQAYLKAAAIDPADAEPLFHAGILYLLAKKDDYAIIQFKRVLQINPRYPEAHYYIGKAQLESGNTGAAIEEADQERKINPYLADAYILKAQAYAKARQFPECAGEYQKAIRLRPQSSAIYVQIAQCYREAGNLNIAMDMLTLAAQKESGNPDIYKEQGLIYEAKEAPRAAIKAFDKYLILAGPGAPDRDAVVNEVRKLGGLPPN